MTNKISIDQIGLSNRATTLDFELLSAFTAGVRSEGLTFLQSWAEQNYALDLEELMIESYRIEKASRQLDFAKENFLLGLSEGILKICSWERPVVKKNAEPDGSQWYFGQQTFEKYALIVSNDLKGAMMLLWVGKALATFDHVNLQVFTQTSHLEHIDPALAFVLHQLKIKSLYKIGGEYAYICLALGLQPFGRPDCVIADFSLDALATTLFEHHAPFLRQISLHFPQKIALFTDNVQKISWFDQMFAGLLPVLDTLEHACDLFVILPYQSEDQLTHLLNKWHKKHAQFNFYLVNHSSKDLLTAQHKLDFLLSDHKQIIENNFAALKLTALSNSMLEQSQAMFYFPITSAGSVFRISDLLQNYFFRNSTDFMVVD